MKVIADFKACVFLKRINSEMLLVICLLVIGIILRIWQYAANRSLWLDELSLALNLIHRSFAGLTQPLDNNQAAPLLFLFIQKIIIIVLGNSEFMLRLFPLMAGIMSLFLMYKTATKYLRGTAVYIALALFCFSATLIYYSSENKQYSSDVMFTLILLLAVHPCLEDAAQPKNILKLAAIGIVAMWMSHPAVFVMAGIGIALPVRQISRKDWPGLLWSGITCLLWLINLAFLYLISLRYTAANNGLTAYWNNSFMPMPPWNNWGWFSNSLIALFEKNLKLTFVYVSAVLLLIGLIAVLLRKWTIGLAFTFTIMATLVASGLHKYPFRGRLILFLVPIIFLLMAAGIEQVRSTLASYSRLVASIVCAALVLLLLAQPVVSTIDGLRNPRMREHIRPVIEYVRQNKSDSDVIYVHYTSKRAFMYYAPFCGFRDSDNRVGVDARSEPAKYLKDVDTLKGQARVWFVFGYLYDFNKIDERLYYLIYLNKIGNKIGEFSAPGAAAYLYDLKGSSKRLL